MEALMLDVKNYDAFRELIEGGMMSAKEGMLNSLSSTVWPDRLMCCRVGVCP